jgi:hypothetical protein
VTPVPGTIDEALSQAWLSRAIADRFPAARVGSVRVSNIQHGVAARAHVEVVYAGGAGALPTRLFIKGGFAPDSRHLLEGGAYYREARFYRDIAPSCDVGQPRCLYAGFDEASKQGVVILEDLGAAGAQLYALGGNHDVDRAETFLTALARLHSLEGGVWVPQTADVVRHLVPSDPLPRLRDALGGERGEVLPHQLRDPKRVLAAMRALMNRKVADRMLLHGDMHLGNLFTHAHGRPGWLDWQTLQSGCWAMDVVYYLVGSLTAPNRRAHVDDLLAIYAARLAEHGGPAIAREDIRALYRTYLAYGLFIWSIARDTIIPLPILKIMLNRFAEAAAEADSFAALRV